MHPEMIDRHEARRLRPTGSRPTPSVNVLPTGREPGESRVHSTMRRIGSHLVNLASNLVGDDIAGRAARRALIRLAGGSVPGSAHLLGGTLFSRPANLRVGARCLINRNCYLDLHGRVTLADDVVIGHGTSVITSHHRLGPSTRRAGSVHPRQVEFGAGAWIGADCVILPGVTIGQGAVVAAAAVVTEDVAPDTLVAGVPARFVRHLDSR